MISPFIDGCTSTLNVICLLHANLEELVHVQETSRVLLSCNSFVLGASVPTRPSRGAKIDGSAVVPILFQRL